MIAGLIITGGYGTDTSIETFPDETDCSIPPFPEPGLTSPLISYHPFIDSPPKGEGATPSLSSTKGDRLWHAEGKTPRLLASLGATGNRTGLTTTP